MTGRVYLERGEPVAVLIRWATMPPAAAAVIWHRPPRRNAPRNVLIERAGGRRVVRPFRGLRSGPDSRPSGRARSQARPNQTDARGLAAAPPGP